ncbi:MAG: hypothetical protein ACOY82_11085 [Pseudomonadota bacterium]
MKMSKPIQIINFDDFLPADGESRFSLHFVDAVLTLEIYFEDDESSVELMRRLRFESAKYFIKTPFPGYSFFSCAEDRDVSLLNSLVQYETSDMLKHEVGADLVNEYKHYRLYLHSSGAAIHVIAKSCDFSD